MTVLVPNTDEAARRRLPAPGDAARLTWSSEHSHLVRQARGGESAPAEEPISSTAEAA
jgi:hypothetical protein